MTLGEAIFWSTVLILFSLGIWQITKQRRWKSVGKVVLGLVLLNVVIGASYWGWIRYQERPIVMSELAGVRLGMTPVEVTLKLGMPEKKEEQSTGTGREMYFDYTDTNFVRFDTEGSEMRACMIGSSDMRATIAGLGTYSSEDEVISKFGQPTKTSINKDGVRKILSYSQWNAAFEIEKGRVVRMIISSSGAASYKEEYGAANDTGNTKPSGTQTP